MKKIVRGYTFEILSDFDLKSSKITKKIHTQQVNFFFLRQLLVKPFLFYFSDVTNSELRDQIRHFLKLTNALLILFLLSLPLYMSPFPHISFKNLNPFYL